MQQAKNRPFVRLAAEICYGKEGLDGLMAGKCPSCGSTDIHFRDQLSRKEFTISGLCQKCQDKVFGE